VSSIYIALKLWLFSGAILVIDDPHLVDVFLRWISPDFGSFFIKQVLAFELGVKKCVIREFYKER